VCLFGEDVLALIDGRTQQDRMEMEERATMGIAQMNDRGGQITRESSYQTTWGECNLWGSQTRHQLVGLRVEEETILAKLWDSVC
jgi:hypothetical protein